MAEEATEGEAPKKPKIVIILIIVVLLAALGGGGYYAYTTFFKKPPADQEKAEKEGEKGEKKKDEKHGEGGAPAGEKTPQPAKPGLGVMASLEPFIVNLAGSQGKRFLKVSVTLELSSAEVHAEVNENIQKITDSILILLSSKTFEDIYSVQGKFKLKDEVTTRVNRFLVLGHVKDAYFTEFVIQ